MVHDLRALDVREQIELGELARTLEYVQRLAHLPEVPLRGRVGEQRAQLELRRLGRKAEVRQRFAGILELLTLDCGLGACDRRLELGHLGGRLAGLEESRVDTEPVGEPSEHLAGRARLPALDLAQVLLRAAIAGELRLRESGTNTQLAQACAERGGRTHLRMRCRRDEHAAVHCGPSGIGALRRQAV